MSNSVRALPGAAALLMWFLAGYAWTFSGEQSSFAVAHIASIVLCLSAPAAFVLLGRLLDCRPHLLKVGGALLLLTSSPLLIANGIYLFSIRTPQNAIGDIGGFGLALLGWAALFITALACTIGIPLATNGGANQHAVSTSSGP